jgi:hypothetical protein
VAVCTECGTPLVGEGDVPAAEAEKNTTVATEGRAETGDDESERRINIGTGVVLIALSILLTMATCAASTSSGGGPMLALGPFIYGLYRLGKALKARENTMKPAAEPAELKALARTESKQASPSGREGDDALSWVCLCGAHNARGQTHCRVCNGANPY